jgi:alpha-tubulin suppressor-like RCC1 family protein
VHQVQATESAFAAILADGSVVTWGNPRSGGDSSAVQEELKNVQEIKASCSEFAAILADGSVVTWGNRVTRGNRFCLHGLEYVQNISGSRFYPMLV